MYLEGALISTISGMMLRSPKGVLALMIVFWPLALPYLMFRAYKAFQPIIAQVQMLEQLQSTFQNPLVGELMDHNTEDLTTAQAGQNL